MIETSCNRVAIWKTEKGPGHEGTAWVLSAPPILLTPWQRFLSFVRFTTCILVFSYFLYLAQARGGETHIMSYSCFELLTWRKEYGGLSFTHSNPIVHLVEQVEELPVFWTRVSPGNCLHFHEAAPILPLIDAQNQPLRHKIIHFALPGYSRRGWL